MAYLGFFSSLLFLALTGCQLGYIAKSAYHQADILRRRVPIEQATDQFSLSPEEKTKILLAIEVRQFIKDSLALKVDENYATYVQLDRDYVTYAVSAAPKDKLEHYRWHFPIVGSVPYKGYFQKDDAQAEAENLQKQNLDVFVRGVAAYSTLGWFSDPLLSSMLRYKDHQLVNTLIHETVHANLYIKSKSAFNERVASYLGMLGMEEYYSHLGQGQEVKTMLANEQHDELLFSQFISDEIKSLRQWYQAKKDDPALIELRGQQFLGMQERFTKNLLPKMKTQQFAGFAEIKLNNARLLLYDLYMADFSDFEKVAAKKGRNFKAMFAYLKTLEAAADPVDQLKQDAL